MSTPLLTIAQVAALPDDSWVNGGVEAHVVKVEPVPKKAGGQFYKATLSDGDSSATTVSMSLFILPKFQAGDVVRIHGKGIKKNSYMGKPQIGLGKETVVDVAPGVAKVQAAASAAVAEHANGAMIPGQQVGMALKEAIALHTRELPKHDLIASLSAPGFWHDVYTTASDIIRVGKLLESGKLCDPVKTRTNGHAHANGHSHRSAPVPVPSHDPESELDEAPPF